MTLSLLNSPVEPALSHNPAFFRLQSDQTSEPNLRVDLTMLESAVQLGQDSLTASSNGIVTFELSEYFKTFFSPNFTFPDAGQNHRAVTGNYKRIGLVFEEFCGSPPVETDQLDIQEFPVICGRIPAYLHTWFYRTYASFAAFIATNKGLMSFWPSTHTVSKTQTEKVYFCNYWDFVADQQLKCYVTIHFTDGTSGAMVQVGASATAISRQWQVWEFHTGYNTLGIDAIALAQAPTKTVSGYDVEIGLATNDIRSNKISYLLDQSYYVNRREFIFRNPLSGYDTFIATGSAQITADYQPEIINVLPWWGITGNGRKTIRTTFDETVECNSGFVSAQTMEAMPQFFESEEVYEIIAGKLYPIGFPQQSVIRHSDKKGLYYFTFSYMYLPINVIETN